MSTCSPGACVCDGVRRAEGANFKSHDWFEALQCAHHDFHLKDPALWRTVGQILAESMAHHPTGKVRDPDGPARGDGRDYRTFGVCSHGCRVLHCGHCMFIWFCPPCPESLCQPLEGAPRSLLQEVGVQGQAMAEVEPLPRSGGEPMKIPQLVVAGLEVSLQQLGCRTLTSGR